MTIRNLLTVAALIAALAGCTSSYTLTLMPRNSGMTYTGEAVERSSTEADVTIVLDGTLYAGNRVYTAADYSNAYVSGGIGFGSRYGGYGGFGVGSVVTVDNPQGSEAKALPRASDGSGLRCDLRGMAPGRGGAGTCLDDKGLVTTYRSA